jgi:hypothetical protein
MAKKTRPLSGQSQRKYFRDLLAGDAGVSVDAVNRLTDVCADELAHIQVRTEKMTARLAIAMLTKRAAKSAPGQASAGQAPGTQSVVADALPTQSADGFDPHAFSLIVVMTKEGKEGLLAKLRAVGDVDQLRAIAKAQHVSLDADLTEPNIVCAAIIAGTEKRIAHRKAAAS